MVMVWGILLCHMILLNPIGFFIDISFCEVIVVIVVPWDLQIKL